MPPWAGWCADPYEGKHEHWSRIAEQATPNSPGTGSARYRGSTVAPLRRLRNGVASVPLTWGVWSRCVEALSPLIDRQQRGSGGRRHPHPCALSLWTVRREVAPSKGARRLSPRDASDRAIAQARGPDVVAADQADHAYAAHRARAEFARVLVPFPSRTDRQRRGDCRSPRTPEARSGSRICPRKIT
jgi:hypothetical protein